MIYSEANEQDRNVVGIVLSREVRDSVAGEGELIK